MALSAGTRLGPYEILAPLGAGAMGEVYRARDTRLDRTVAIKVLASRLPESAQVRRRFEREARALSSLSHPHICTLYDIGRENGVDFLVMEYLEGLTLASRLEQGPLSTEEVLRYGIEIADALDKAHRQGVIHRDLKPGNIMLANSGAKLVDFGLAKASTNVVAAAGAQTAAFPATTETLTAEGTIVGTFQYMAPEQLEGQEADARTDLFALGAVLYEMTTGHKAFAGKSQASLIAAVLSSDPPPISSLRPMTPPALDRVVRTCLAKDPDERFQSAHDLKLQLDWIAEVASPSGLPGTLAARRQGREVLGWILAAFLLLSLLGTLAVTVIHPGESKRAARAIRFLVPLPEKQSFRLFDLPVASPDGQSIAFTSATSEGKNILWVRRLDSLSALALTGTEGASLPFWCPDGRTVAFFANGKLKKIEASGGAPQTLVETFTPEGGTWNRDGDIVFGSTLAGPLLRVSAAGGEAKPLTTLDRTRGETSHRWPFFLPDGSHFLYLALSSKAEAGGIYVGSLEGRERKRLMTSASNALFSPPGYLLFVREHTLVAQPFNPKGLQFRGDPVAVAEHVALMGSTYRAAFSVSENGLLAYRSGGDVGNTQLVWFDRQGKSLGPVSEPDDYTNPSLSPDGKKVVVGRVDPRTKTRDIWLFDSTRGTRLRLTFDPSDDLNPVWSPDGSRIAFTSDRKGQRDLYQKPASGTGEDELLLESNLNKNVEDWSLDGRFILFSMSSPHTRSEVWMLPLFGDRKPRPVLRNPFSQDQSQLSPNGHWIAYRSNESGQGEVYVQSFPEPGVKWQISTTGGSEPRWRRDGKELFYIAGQKLMAVAVKTDSAEFEPGIPKALFEAGFASVIPRNRYLVSADGQRFLINTSVREETSSEMVVVVPWTAALHN